MVDGRDHPCRHKDCDKLHIPNDLKILRLDFRRDTSYLTIDHSGVWGGWLELLVVHPRCPRHAYVRAIPLFAWHTRQQSKVCTTLRPTGGFSMSGDLAGHGSGSVDKQCNNSEVRSADMT